MAIHIECSIYASLHSKSTALTLADVTVFRPDDFYSLFYYLLILLILFRAGTAGPAALPACTAPIGTG